MAVFESCSLRTARVAATLAAVAIATSLALGSCGGHDSPPTGVAPSLTPPPTAGPPESSVLSASCDRIGLGSAQYTCRDDAARLEEPVMAAIATLKKEHPEYFKGETILNGPGYYVGLIKILDRDGICGYFDSEELVVKSSNAFSEQYKLQTSWRTIRRAYMGVCYPAWIPPKATHYFPVPAGCNLGASREVLCDMLDPQYRGDVERAIDTVINEKPALFDLTRTAAGRANSPFVRDANGYHAAIIEVLTRSEFCGRFDGEEIQVKRSNETSEHYDIILGDGYVRRGPGSYRGTCYPAAF